MKNPIGRKPLRKVEPGDREKLIALAPGCVRPTGWVMDLARIEASAWLKMIVRRDEYSFVSSFHDGSPTPFGGEWAGYWNDGSVGLALLTGDPDCLADARERIETILEAAEGSERFMSPHYNGWGTHLMLMSLMTWFEANGDPRVLAFCHRIALELLDDLNSGGHALEGDHPVNFVSSCGQLYGYTGDERMLSMAHEIAARFDAAGLPNLTRLLHDDRLEGHCVNYCEDIRYPADLYISSGNPNHLAASVRGVELTLRDHMQAQGAPSGNEPVYGKGPLKETEHCDTVEWSFVGHSLLTATGDPRYADLAEKSLFNAWAGSRKPDGTSVCYNHMPNQLTASVWEGSWTPRMCYSPVHAPLCCNLNSHRAVHPYAFRMWMLTPDGGPAAVYYGDCRLQVEVPGAGVVEIVEETDYPFGEHVRITVTAPAAAEFPVSLRVPSWCGQAEVTVNERRVGDAPKAGTFHRIERVWQPGDVIDLELPMPIKLRWAEIFEEPAFHDVNKTSEDHVRREPQFGLREAEDSVSGRHLVSVSRGPLVYALHIKPFRTVQERCEDDRYLVENVTPDPSGVPWNVALIVDQDRPEKSFEFVNLHVPPGSAPFARPPVGLKCRAKIVNGWTAAGSPDKPETSLPSLPLSELGAEVEALLVPFGCTDIRFAWMPHISE